MDPTVRGAVAGSTSGFTVLLTSALVLAVIAGIVAAWMSVANRFTAADATEIGLAVATIGLGMITASVFVCVFCRPVRPVERFVNVGTLATAPAEDPAATALLSGIADAEQKTCELITRADKFIESDVGKPGQDDPSLVVAAQRKARAAVPGGALVSCTTDTPEPGLATADERLTLLEHTLRSFTGPELEATYTKSAAGCEGFSDGPAPTIPALQARLDTVNAIIADQHKRLLDPIDERQARLQRGEVSDCQKKMGAGAGADAAAAAKQPPPGTPLREA